MKKRKLVNWEKPQKDSGMGWKQWFVEAAWECAALLLLTFAAISMLSKLNPRDAVSGAHAFWIALCIIIAVLLREGGLYGILCISRDGKRETLVWLLCRLMPVLVVIPLLLLAWSRHAEEIREGLLAVAVDVITVYNIAFHRNVAVAGGSEEWISAALQFTVLGLFFLFLLSPGIGKRKWQFVLLPAATTVLLMYLGLAPEWKEILWMLAGILMVHCSRRTGGIRPRKALAIALCLAGISLLGLVMGSSAVRLLERSEETKEFEKRLEEGIKNFSLLSFSSGKATVSNKAPKYRDKKIMTVRMDQKPQTNLYFQEISAADYNKGEWSSPINEFSAFCAENGFDEKWAAKTLSSSLFHCISPELYQLALDWDPYRAGYKKDYAWTQYQIKYHRLRNSFLLLPYGADTESVEGIRFDGKAIARKDFGRNVVSFEGWNGNELEENSLIYEKFGGYSESNDAKMAFWEKYNEFVREHYLSYPDYVETLDTYPYYLAVMDAENSAYQRVEYKILDEGQIWEIVDENGMLTDIDMEKLNAFVIPIEYDEMSNSGRVQVTLNLSEVMTGTNSIYSWALDELGSDQDPVEYFLRNRRKGYCTHYASAAVFLLRSVGIPARFASGYMLKPSAFIEQADGSYAAEVIDRNGHAWVEIYLNDVGWIPVEMTPGYEADQTTMPTDKDMEELRRTQEKAEEARATPSPTPEVTPSPTPEATQKPEETAAPKETKAPKHPEGKGGKAGKSAEGTDTKVYAWIAAAVAALAMAVVLFEHRRAARRRLQMALKRKYYKAAVVMMNRRVYRRLRKKSKIRKRNLTDRDFEEMLVTAFGEESRSTIAEYMRVVKAAAFSDGKLSKEDCKLVWRIYKTVN